MPLIKVCLHVTIGNNVQEIMYSIIGIMDIYQYQMQIQCWWLKNWKGCKKKNYQKKKTKQKNRPVNYQLTHFIIITSLLSYFTNYVKLRSAVIIMPPSQTRYHYTVFSSIIVWLSWIPVFIDHFTAGIIPYPVSPVFIPYASVPRTVSIHWNIQVYFS